jgi:cellulose synthase/poly-beta-1,6-N-acetylglucosamine synthase-like glycosyltransferase
MQLIFSHSFIWLLLTTSGLFTVVQGQSPSETSPELVFNTSFPAIYTVGVLGNVSWSGGNGQPLNVSLFSGDAEEERICSKFFTIELPVVKN